MIVTKGYTPIEGDGVAWLLGALQRVHAYCLMLMSLNPP